jgi:hypothetical protein
VSSDYAVKNVLTEQMYMLLSAEIIKSPEHVIETSVSNV